MALPQPEHRRATLTLSTPEVPEPVDAIELATRRRRAFLRVADASGVPWSYDLPLKLPADYRAWLVHVYICRSIGVDPESPPAVLGDSPSRPEYDPEALEGHLVALSDFSCHPLHEFAELFYTEDDTLWLDRNGA